MANVCQIELRNLPELEAAFHGEPVPRGWRQSREPFRKDFEGEPPWEVYVPLVKVLNVRAKSDAGIEFSALDVREHRLSFLRPADWAERSSRGYCVFYEPLQTVEEVRGWAADRNTDRSREL